ncbi:MAG: dTDP-4-dehydrorhamnose reductase [Terriglobia bacterium]
MKVAITGAAGLFGRALVQVFGERHAVSPLAHEDLDITREDEVEAVLSKIKPDVVVHAAAIPNPDVCEENPARAYAVNVHGTRYVAAAARRAGARMATISTDAVFNGQKTSPYIESDSPAPETVYGRTKWRSEIITEAANEWWIFRVSVLFGPGKENFVEKGLRRIAAGEPYVVAADQTGNATYTIDAARKIREVVEAKRYGLYHLANDGFCTRLELARRAAELAGLDPGGIRGKPLSQMGRPARRLPYSVMDSAALERSGFSPLRQWTEALEEYIREYTGQISARSATTSLS